MLFRSRILEVSYSAALDAEPVVLAVGEGLAALVFLDGHLDFYDLTGEGRLSRLLTLALDDHDNGVHVEKTTDIDEPDRPAKFRSFLLHVKATKAILTLCIPACITFEILHLIYWINSHWTPAGKVDQVANLAVLVIDAIGVGMTVGDHVQAQSLTLLVHCRIVLLDHVILSYSTTHRDLST